MHFTPGIPEPGKEERLETTEDAAESLGDRITRLRRARGWKQRDLAERIGTRAAQVSKFECGNYVPRLDLLARLGEVFDVSLDYLITGREIREPQRDFRLRDRVEALETLPANQRDNLVSFLDALLTAHQLLRQFQEQRLESAPPRRPRRSRPKKSEG